jgi:hypothetical protein
MARLEEEDRVFLWKGSILLHQIKMAHLLGRDMRQGPLTCACNLGF